MVATIPLSLDMYLPAMSAMSVSFHTEMAMVQMTLSVFLLGYALGQLFFGPMADIVGRRDVVLVGLLGYTLTNWALAFVESIEFFLALRLIQAFIGAAAVVPVMGYIKSIYGKNMAKGVSYVTMIMMLAPMIAPTLGIVLMELHNWTLIFSSLGLYGLVILVFAFFMLPKVEKVQQQKPLSHAFFHAYKVVFSEAKVRRYLVMVCFGAMSFFAYLTAIPFVYMEVYGVDETQFGVLFAINVGMFMLSSFVNSRLVGRYGSLRMARGTLVIALVGAVSLLTVNLLQLHLYYTVVSLGIFLFGLMALSINTDALIVLQFPDNTGTATGVIGVMRFGCGALSGPILAFFQSDSAVPFTVLIFIAMLVNLVFIPWRENSS